MTILTPEEIAKKLILLFLLVGFLVVSGEVKGSQENKKLTIDFSRIKIEEFSCEWGEVSLDTTTVKIEVLTNEENLYLIPLKVSCNIYLNDVELVSDLGEDLKITKVEGGSILCFTVKIKNQNIIKWWVSHIKGGERTEVKIEGKVILLLGEVEIFYPFSSTSEFETNILEGLNKKNVATIRPYNFKIQKVEARWGEVSSETTEIQCKITIKNIGVLPGQPITDVEYILTFNKIQMAKGKVGLPLLILPSQKRCAKFSLKISNESIIKWWVSHIQNGETTGYCLNYRLWVKPLVKTKWQKTCGNFKTDVLGQDESTRNKPA